METIPPGVIEVAADGRRKQKYFHDFYNYPGLARSVWLASRPAVHVDDMTVVTELEGTTGVVDDTVVTGRLPQVRGTTARRLRCRWSRHPPVRAGTLRVADARLWQPGAAYLYDLTVEAVVEGERRRQYACPSASAP